MQYSNFKINLIDNPMVSSLYNDNLSFVSIITNHNLVINNYAQASTDTPMTSGVMYIPRDPRFFVIFTLPDSPILGDIVEVDGYSSGGWQINKGTAASFVFGSQNISSNIQSGVAFQWATVTVRCVLVDDTGAHWAIIMSIGDVVIN